MDSLPWMLLVSLLFAVHKLQATAMDDFEVEVVSYEDGPDEEALVDINSLHLYGSHKARIHQDSENDFSSFLESQSWSSIGAKVPPMRKNVCCDDEGCCGNKADPDAARFRLDSKDPGTAGLDASSPPPGAPFESAIPESPPDDDAFKGSFLELDSMGKPIIVNKMCCAGGAGPPEAKVGGAGGDQFAAASVPSVPCVCTLVVNGAASAGGAGAAVAAGSAGPSDLPFGDEPKHSKKAPPTVSFPISFPAGGSGPTLMPSANDFVLPTNVQAPPPPVQSNDESSEKFYEKLPDGRINVIKPEYFDVGNGVHTLKDIHETKYRHAWTQGSVRPNPVFKKPIHAGNHFPWSSGAFKKPRDRVEEIIQKNTDRSDMNCRTVNGVLEC